MNNRTVLCCATSLVVFFCTTPGIARADDPSTLFKDGKIFGELRYRYEHVDQDGVANDANANTARFNLGAETGRYMGWKALIEGQLVRHIGSEDFNSLDNGHTTYATVADPDTTQLNRAYISFTGLPKTDIKVGRQDINLDNQRFIGTVGWRQNDQTFDAASVSNTSIDGLKLYYGYVANVHRIFGGPTPPDRLDSIAHLANVAYNFSDLLNVTAYGYWMRFDNAATLSSTTYGLRATGNAPVNANWTFGYEAELAKQKDQGNNPANYDENYYHVAASMKGYGFQFAAGYEMLGGNGTNAFQTPLATLHKFNGWADKFLTTPANGLKDAYLSASYKFGDTQTLLDGTKLAAVYHNFDGDKNGDYGSELDLSASKTFALPSMPVPLQDLDVQIKYADYNGEDAPYTDTEKFWIQIGVKF